jgi:hypothetical protein
VHLVGFIRKKFVTMHGHTNLKMLMKFYGMRWAGHMARSEAGCNAHRVLVANMRERHNLEHIGLYERMILKMDLQAEG